MALDFDAIRRDHPLTAILDGITTLRRAGVNKVAKCPLHADKSPSFVVYRDQTYHCFGCGAHGDVIDFVGAYKHLDILGSINFLTGGERPMLDPADRQKRIDDERHRDTRQRKHQEDAIQSARARWARALPINGVPNPYLERKRVAPYGCRCEGDNLLVPVYDGAGLILSVQSIAPDGGKLFHAGAPVAGGTLTIGEATDGPIVICEGFATGATVQAATGHLVVIGFSIGLLVRTAELVASRYPGRRIIIAADSNGLATAQEAADKVAGQVVRPEIWGDDGTDFNDQAALSGLESVAALFNVPAETKLVHATPFTWRDAADIPPRIWLYGKHLLRKFVSVDVAAGGVGKSSLKIGEALALASGRDIYGKGLPAGQCNVWLWNLEDPHDELERRIHATAIRFMIKAEEVATSLFVDSGRDQPLVIATEGPTGTIISRPIVDALIDEMLARHIDVLIVDPFISSHAVSENDNNAIDIVAREWNVVAERTGAAINLVHHVRKANGAEANADSARGASSLIGKARSVLVYNRMTKEEADTLGVDQAERRFFFRVDIDKANLAPPEASDWYRMNNVDLDNGDSVGVACPWIAQDAFEGVTRLHIMAVQKAIGAGKWRENVQAKAWAGIAVANALQIDINDKKVVARVKKILRRWIDEGVLEVVKDFDEKSNERNFIVVGNWVTE